MSVKKIILAFDNSADSEKALQWTISFAKDNRAEVHITNVIESVYTDSFEEVYNLTTINNLRKKDITEKTAKAEAICKEHNIVSKAIMLEGQPAEEIINYAEKINADLIVCGTRGHGGFSALLLGSTAHKLVTYATIPVVVVK